MSTSKYRYPVAKGDLSFLPGPPPSSKAFQSNGSRKARTNNRRDLQVPAFWMKPGCIFHLPPLGPEKSIANCQVDKGWWNHPVLILDYDRATERAKVLLISTLHGRTIEESYDPGVTMRRRLLYIEDAKDVKLPEGVPTLKIQEGFHELYEQSYVKINPPVVVEREYIHHLDRGKSVKLDDASMATVNEYLENYMKGEGLSMGEIYAMVAEYTHGLESTCAQELSSPANRLSLNSIQRSRTTGTPSPARSSALKPKQCNQWGSWGNANVFRMGTIGQTPPKTARPRISAIAKVEESEKENLGAHGKFI